VHCHDATASSFVTKVRDKVFSHFHALSVKHHSSMWNVLFGLPGGILCEFFLMSKKILSMLLTLLFTCLAFSVLVSLDFTCTTHAFFLECLFNQCQGLLRTFSYICAKLMLFHCQFRHEITSGQVHDSK
jgi:hypothetical protein